MSKVVASLSDDGTRIEVRFPYETRTKDAVKSVPGARFVPKDKGGPLWRLPLSLMAARRLREEVGSGLGLSDELRAWGREAVRAERNLLDLASIDDLPVEELKIATKLPALATWFRGYQRADVKFLAYGTNKLNANDQGLGKTTELIAAIYEADLELGPHLVIAPATSLDLVWRAELERWQDIPVFTYSGDLSKKEKAAVIDEISSHPAQWPFWFVTTAEMLRRDLPVLDRVWNSFIIDEYRKMGLCDMSGDHTKGSAFARAALAVQARKIYLSSGTPMGGREINLWPALHLLDQQRHSSKWAWANHWLVVRSNGYGQDILGVQPGREDDFYQSLAPYMVRRRKSEVLKQLPPKQYIDVLCPMTPKQKKQYTKFANDAEVEIDMYNLSATNVLAEYARLKMFANSYCDVELVPDGRRCPACKGAESFEPCTLCRGSGKVDALKLKATSESGKLKPLLERLAEQGITSDDPEGDSVAVVASQSKEFVDMVTTFLNSKGIRSEKISGDIRPRERTRLVKAFQNADPGSPRVICMVTASGGVAITLDRADTVHIMDETWNPDDQFQVEDRIHRASRMHQVLCFYYRSEDTLQEYIKETNDAKAFTTTKILDLRREGFRATRQKQRAQVGQR